MRGGRWLGIQLSGAVGSGPTIAMVVLGRPKVVRGAAEATPLSKSATQAEPRDQFAVVLDVLLGDVVQQPAALADQQQQATAAVVVALVHLEVLGQVCDPLGEQRDLDVRRSGVQLKPLPTPWLVPARVRHRQGLAKPRQRFAKTGVG